MLKDKVELTYFLEVDNNSPDFADQRAGIFVTKQDYENYKKVKKDQGVFELQDGSLINTNSIHGIYKEYWDF